MQTIGKLLIVLIWSYSFHQAESPVNGMECSEDDGLNFCNSKFVQCLTETRETVDCHSPRCTCLREVPISASKCKNYTEDICIDLQDQEEMILTQTTVIYLLDTRMKLFEVSRKSLMEHCLEDSEYNRRMEMETSSMPHSNEVFSKKILPAFVLTDLIIDSNRSSACQGSIDNMLVVMKKVDALTFSKMPFSFDQSHCGWALGDLVRIIWRAAISETLPNFMGDFNHCCAVERDCYISGTNSFDCVKKSELCTTGIIDKLERGKSKAKTLKEVLMKMSERTRQLISQNKIKTETHYMSYSGEFEKSFDRSESFDNLNKTVTFLLEPNHQEIEDDEELRRKKQKSFQTVYKRCKFHRISFSDSSSDFPSPILIGCCPHQRVESYLVIRLRRPWQDWALELLESSSASSWSSGGAIGGGRESAGGNENISTRALRCLESAPFMTRLYGHDRCPSASNLIDFCTSEFNLCIDEKSGFQICASQFCDCSKSNVPQSEQRCRDNITDTCRLLQSRSAAYATAYVPFEWPVDLKQVLKELNDLCGLETNTDKEISINTFVQTISTNECFQENKHKLDDVLTKLNTATSEDFQVSLDRFRCGWHLGDMGRVLSRYWVAEACGPYSVDVNHCCAVHLNCYMTQMGKEDCDQQYSMCRKNLVSRMVSYKNSCAAFVSQNDHEIFVPSFETYQSFKNIKMTTQIASFNGKLKNPLLSSTNYNFSQIKIFQLKASPSLNHEIREKFNKEIYKNGWNNRVIIDSCGMIFEDCSQHDKASSCLKKLVYCLYTIHERGDEFEMALRDFNQTVSSLFIAPLSKEEVEEMISESFRKQLLILFLESLVLWLLPKAWKNRAKIMDFCNCWRVCRGNPLPTPELPEAMEMMERSSARTGEGGNTAQ